MSEGGGEAAAVPAEGEKKTIDQVRFHYIKSNSFRVIHADGAFGGLSPRGGIHMALYNERLPIPRETVHEVTPEGKLGKEIRPERVAREGIVREVEVGVVMSIDTTRSLIEWLTRKVEEAEKLERGDKA